MPTAGSSRPPSITTSPSRGSSLPRSRSSSPPTQTTAKTSDDYNLNLKYDATKSVAVKPLMDDEGEDEVEPEELDEEEVESLSNDRVARTKR